MLFALLSPPKPHLKESESKPFRVFLVGFGHLTFNTPSISRSNEQLIRFPQGNNFTETLAFCSTINFLCRACSAVTQRIEIFSQKDLWLSHRKGFIGEVIET